MKKPLAAPSRSKDRKKMIASLVLLSMVWILTATVFKPNHPVTEEEMRKYAETYLSTYRNLVYRFNPKDRTYFLRFTQFWDKVDSLQATISETHGAAMEFVLDSTLSTFQARRSDERIEVAIFDGVFRRVKPAGVFGELPLRIAKLRLIFRIGSPAIFDTGGVCLFEVFDNASLAVLGSDWTLNGIRYTNPITMKGSNMYEAWSEGKAIWEAEFDFKFDLADALNESEGVREYVAYSDLKERLNDMADKLQNNPSYGWSELDSDLGEVSSIALEKYGVTRPEFVREVFDVIKEKRVLIKKLPVLQIEYHDNLWYTVFFSFAVDSIYIVGIFLLPRLLKKLRRKKQTSLVRIVKELGKTLSVTVVFGFLWLNAPYDYRWFDILIVVVQFTLCMAVSTVLEDGRRRLKLDWSRVLHRTSVGAFFLIIFLVSTPLWIPVFFTIPSMFRLFLIGIGHATPLSILVATMSVLVVVVSQLIYDRFSSSRG